MGLHDLPCFPSDGKPRIAGLSSGRNFSARKPGADDGGGRGDRLSAFPPRASSYGLLCLCPARLPRWRLCLAIFDLWWCLCVKWSLLRVGSATTLGIAEPGAWPNDPPDVWELDPELVGSAWLLSGWNTSSPATNVCCGPFVVPALDVAVTEYS